MILTTGQPFWLLERGLLRYPVLTQDQQADVVVLGGGISGALMGYHLTRAGLRVVLLEAAYLGAGSTAASTAMCQYELDAGLGELRQKVGMSRANDAYRANVYAVHALGQLCREQLPSDCGFRDCPSLYLASRPGHVAGLREEGEARRGLGIEANFLDRAELSQRYGLKAPGALLSGDTAQVNPYELTHALLAEATATGLLQAFERSAATSYVADDHGVTVRCATGQQVRAKHVVVCTGFAAADLVPQDIVSLHSTYVVLSRPGEAAGLPTGPAQIWETARPYLYARITPDGRLMAGGRDEVVKNASFQGAMLERKAGQLREQFQGLFDQPPPFTRDFAWGGVYGVTDDALPYIGAHPDFPRAYFALGYGGNGTTFSLLAAEIIRDALTGQRHRYADTFGFDRR